MNYLEAQRFTNDYECIHCNRLPQMFLIGNGEYEVRCQIEGHMLIKSKTLMQMYKDGEGLPVGIINQLDKIKIKK